MSIAWLWNGTTQLSLPGRRYPGGRTGFSAIASGLLRGKLMEQLLSVGSQAGKTSGGPDLADCVKHAARTAVRVRKPVAADRDAEQVAPQVHVGTVGAPRNASADKADSHL